MFKVIIALSMSSLLLISMANAQPKGGIMKAAHELGLTDDQMDKMADMRFEHQKEMIRKKAALQEVRLEMRHLMRNAEVDKKAALATQKKISSIKADVTRIKLDHRLEMRGVLSSGQLEKWMKICRKHGQRDGMRHKGERGHRDMGPHHEEGHKSGVGPKGDAGPGADHGLWD